MLQRARVYYHTQTSDILAIFPEVDNPWVTQQPTLEQDLSLNKALRDVDPGVLGVLTLLPGQHKEDLRTKMPIKVEDGAIVWVDRPADNTLGASLSDRLDELERRLRALEGGA